MSILHVNGIELYYESEGDGEPLLLLHGMMAATRIGTMPGGNNFCVNTG
jgi:hypothetical protein